MSIVDDVRIRQDWGPNGYQFEVEKEPEESASIFQMFTIQEDEPIVIQYGSMTAEEQREHRAKVRERVQEATEALR